MLEQFLIFTKGGLVLFRTGTPNLPGEPTAQLVQSVLLEGRIGESSFSTDKYMLEWHLINEHDLILVVVYEKLLAKHVTYVRDLLHLVEKYLLRECGSQLPSRGGVPAKMSLLSKTEFESRFNTILQEAIQRAEQRRDDSKQPAEFWETKKGQELMKQRGIDSDNSHDKHVDSTKNSPSSSAPTKRLSKVELAAQKRAAKAAQKGDVKIKTPSWIKDKPVNVKELDKSEQQEVDVAAVNIDDMQFDPEATSSGDGSTHEEEQDTDDGESASRGIFGLFRLRSLTQKELTEEHLKPVIDDIRQHLITKNVASDIAESICESVMASLKGQTHSNFTSISSTVKTAMAEALTRILTPKRSVDIPREILAAKSAGRPYSIVFVGVNGVGKSTTLAKVCAWLLKQKLRVMIAACDTFRSGAVEQLATHAQALGGVPLFDQGYGKDAADIAQKAIAKAHTDGIDVVLIDTAGRMQNNLPLMEALAKLIKVNNPDLILFVGEALVGNVSVDQLVKFNRAFEEQGMSSSASSPRSIDGIILTKFDTVDDKVGAAISMVYTTGQPIIFVGVGQNYSDLRTLNVKKIVDILAKGSST